MPDKSVSDRADWNFGRLLKWHLFERGTRPGGKPRKVWRKNEFAGAAKYGSGNNVGSWITGLHVPRNVEHITDALLGDEDDDDALFAEYRGELRKKYQAAKNKLRQNSGLHEGGADSSFAPVSGEKNGRTASKQKEQKDARATDSAKLSTVHRLTIEKALAEAIQQRRPRLEKMLDIVASELAALIVYNTTLKLPDDFDTVPLETLWYGLLAFFIFDPTFYTDKTFYEAQDRDDHRVTVLNKAAILEVFPFKQWLHVDVIHEKLGYVSALLNEIRAYAATIDATATFEQWERDLFPGWTTVAQRYLVAAKPRIDDIRASWDDPGAEMMRTAREARVTQ